MRPSPCPTPGCVRSYSSNVWTVPYEAGYEDRTPIGYVSQHGDVNKRITMTKTEGVTGVTGNTGW